MKKHNIDILAYDSNTAERDTSTEYLVQAISLTGTITPYRNKNLNTVMGHQKIVEFIERNSKVYGLPDVTQILYTIFNRIYEESEDTTVVIHDIYNDLVQQGYDKSYETFKNQLLAILKAGVWDLASRKTPDLTDAEDAYDLEFFKTLLSDMEEYIPDVQ